MKLQTRKHLWFGVAVLAAMLLALMFTAHAAGAAGQFSVRYQTHIQKIGWQAWKNNGATSGTQGQSKRLEAIKIKLLHQPVDGKIEYRTHIQKIGWEKGWRSNGKTSGTSGRSLRLEAIQIRLTRQLAKQYDVYYRVHAQHFGWMGWAKNGAFAGTQGYSYRLEAIQIRLVRKGGSAPGSTANAFRKVSQATLARRAYRSIVRGIARKYQYQEYYLFDMNRDGVPELITNRGTCEANNQIYVYTYAGGRVKQIHHEYNRHLAYYGESGNSGNLIAVYGHMGYEAVFRWTYNGRTFRKQTIRQRELKNWQDYYSNSHPVKWYDVTNLKPLN